MKYKEYTKDSTLSLNLIQNCFQNYKSKLAAKKPMHSPARLSVFILNAWERYFTARSPYDHVPSFFVFLLRTIKTDIWTERNSAVKCRSYTFRVNMTETIRTCLIRLDTLRRTCDGYLKWNTRTKEDRWSGEQKSHCLERTTSLTVSYRSTDQKNVNITTNCWYSRFGDLRQDSQSRHRNERLCKFVGFIKVTKHP